MVSVFQVQGQAPSKQIQPRKKPERIVAKKQSENRNRLLNEIMKMLGHWEYATLKANLAANGIKPEKFAGYLAGFGSGEFQIDITLKNAPTPEKRREIVKKLHGQILAVAKEIGRKMHGAQYSVDIMLNPKTGSGLTGDGTTERDIVKKGYFKIRRNADGAAMEAALGKKREDAPQQHDVNAGGFAISKIAKKPDILLAGKYFWKNEAWVKKTLQENSGWLVKASKNLIGERGNPTVYIDGVMYKGASPEASDWEIVRKLALAVIYEKAAGAASRNYYVSTMLEECGLKVHQFDDRKNKMRGEDPSWPAFGKGAMGITSSSVIQFTNGQRQMLARRFGKLNNEWTYASKNRRGKITPWLDRDNRISKKAKADINNDAKNMMIATLHIACIGGKVDMTNEEHFRQAQEYNKSDLQWEYARNVSGRIRAGWPLRTIGEIRRHGAFAGGFGAIGSEINAIGASEGGM